MKFANAIKLDKEIRSTLARTWGTRTTTLTNPSRNRC